MKNCLENANIGQMSEITISNVAFFYYDLCSANIRWMRIFWNSCKGLEMTYHVSSSKLRYYEVHTYKLCINHKGISIVVVLAQPCLGYALKCAFLGG